MWYSSSDFGESSTTEPSAQAASTSASFSEPAPRRDVHEVYDKWELGNIRLGYDSRLQMWERERGQRQA